MCSRHALAAVLIAATSAASFAGDEATSLRFAPSQDDQFFTRITSDSVEVTSEVAGAPTPSTTSHSRTMYFSNDVTDVADDGAVTLTVGTRHLHITIDRPDWDKPDYDSLQPKRNPKAATRLLDHFVNRQSLLNLFIQPDGTVTDTLHLDRYTTSMAQYIARYGMSQGFLSTLRDDLITQSVERAMEGPYVFLTDKKVKPGDSWTSSYPISIPYAGSASVIWTNTLETIQDDRGTPIAIIRSTARAKVESNVPPGTKIAITMRDFTGDSLTHVDLNSHRPVFSESHLTIPLTISTPNPEGGRDVFKKTYTLTNRFEDVHENEIPLRAVRR